MRSLWPVFQTFIFSVLLAWPATAQQQGLNWQHDIDSARILAGQTGRLVLVHCWAPNCGPCLMLEQNVFSQPGVAGAIEAQFVAVKLNADENPGTAQGLGITRVPTDVIITPNGQVVDKLISPPTPSAYIAEVTKIANQYAARSGGAFSDAVATAPQINAAYASLPVGSVVPPALSPVTTPQVTGAAISPNVGSVAARVPQAASPTSPYMAPQAVAGDRYQTPFAASQAVTPPAGLASVPAAAAPQGSVATSALPPASNQAQPVPEIIPNRYAQLPAGIPPSTPAAAPPMPSSSTAFSTVPSAPLAANAPSSATSATTEPSQVDNRRLPPGAPPLGFEGYCPTSMRSHWKWVKGDPRWGAIHRGRTYWFASQQEQQQFLQKPDYYAPALSGNDPVLAIEHKQIVPGLREHSLDYDNLIYLFASEATLEQFTANPERYAASVRQAMGIERGRLVR